MKIPILNQEKSKMLWNIYIYINIHIYIYIYIYVHWNRHWNVHWDMHWHRSRASREVVGVALPNCTGRREQRYGQDGQTGRQQQAETDDRRIDWSVCLWHCAGVSGLGCVCVYAIERVHALVHFARSVCARTRMSSSIGVFVCVCPCAFAYVWVCMCMCVCEHECVRANICAPPCRSKAHTATESVSASREADTDAPTGAETWAEIQIRIQDNDKASTKAQGTADCERERERETIASRALLSKGKTPNLACGVLNNNANVGARFSHLHRCPPAPPSSLISRLMTSPVRRLEMLALLVKKCALLVASAWRH